MIKSGIDQQAMIDMIKRLKSDPTTKENRISGFSASKVLTVRNV